MSLLDRMSNRTRIGLASIGVLLGASGCTTNDSTAYYGASQIYAAGSENAAAAGNNKAAVGLAMLSNIAGFMANGAQQKEAAIAGRTQVIINQQPAVQQPPVGYGCYIANEWKDTNGNGLFDPSEIVGLNRYTFRTDEPIEMGIWATNNAPFSRRFSCTNMDTSETIETDLMLIDTNSTRMTKIKPHSLTPGTYRLYVMDKDRKVFDGFYFKIVDENSKESLEPTERKKIIF